MFHFAVIIIGIALLPVATAVALGLARAALEVAGEMVAGLGSVGAAITSWVPVSFRACGAVLGELVGTICVFAGLLACLLFFASGCYVIILVGGNVVLHPTESFLTVRSTMMAILVIGGTTYAVAGIRYFWRALDAQTAHVRERVR